MPDLRFNRSALHAAAIEGDLELVKKLIADGATLEALDDFGDTPLLAAVGVDKVDVAKALLEAGAKLQYHFQREDTKDERAKQEAETREIMEMAEVETLELFRDLNETEEEAVAAFEKEIAEQVEFAFEPESKSAVDDCASLAMAKLLFEEFDADINHVGGDGYFPLKTFAEASNEEAVAWLLEHGAAVDQTSTGDTALHAAVQADSIPCATVLLDVGADPNAEDVDGWNPLFSVHGKSMLDLLLARGAKVAPDEVGFLPSDYVEDEMKPVLRKLEKAAGFEESEGKRLLEEGDSC